MSYTPTGYAARTIYLAVDTLCAMSIWQGLAGGSAPLAKQRCVLGVGGFAHDGQFRAADNTRQPLATPLAQFALGQPESTPDGFRKWTRDGDVTVDFAIAPLGGADDVDAYGRALDLIELIDLGFESASDAGTLVLQRVRVTGTPMLADLATSPQWLKNSHLAQLTLSWSIGGR